MYRPPKELRLDTGRIHDYTSDKNIRLTAVNELDSIGHRHQGGY